MHVYARTHASIDRQGGNEAPRAYSGGPEARVHISDASMEHGEETQDWFPRASGCRKQFEIPPDADETQLRTLTVRGHA